MVSPCSCSRTDQRGFNCRRPCTESLLIPGIDLFDVGGETEDLETWKEIQSLIMKLLLSRCSWQKDMVVIDWLIDENLSGGRQGSLPILGDCD